MRRDDHELGELYYAYFYDVNTRPLRVTNISEYSKKEKERRELDIICTEYHFEKSQADILEINPLKHTSTFIESSRRELQDLQIIKKNSLIESDGFVVPTRVFPVPLINKDNTFRSIIDPNILYSGREKSKENFFLVDTLKSIFAQINDKPVFN